MKNRPEAIFIIVLLVAIFSGAVFAQETPLTEDMLVQTTLEDVTADSSIFYERTVALQGFVEYFLSTNVFVLHEAAALDDDKVIVINNTDIFIADFLRAGDELVVRGIVHPSRNEMLAATEDEALIYIELQTQEPDPSLTTAEVAITAALHTEPMNVLVERVEVETVPDRLATFYTGVYPELFNSYTIIEITAVDGLMTVPAPEAE